MNGLIKTLDVLKYLFPMSVASIRIRLIKTLDVLKSLPAIPCTMFVRWLIKTLDVLKYSRASCCCNKIMINKNIRCIEISLCALRRSFGTGLIKTLDVLKYSFPSFVYFREKWLIKTLDVLKFEPGNAFGSTTKD